MKTQQTVPEAILRKQKTEKRKKELKIKRNKHIKNNLREINKEDK